MFGPRAPGGYSLRVGGDYSESKAEVIGYTIQGQVPKQ